MPRIQMRAGKGTRFPSEHSVSADPATGAVVHQVTSHPSINHGTYFLQSSFAPDGRSLLFVSCRSGNAQLYEVEDFPSGGIRQLTDGAPVHPFSAAFHPDGSAIFFAWHITPNKAGSLVLCDTNHPDEGIFLVDVASGERRRVCLSGSSNRGTQWAKSRYALAEDFQRARTAGAADGLLSWMEAPTDTVYGPQWTHPHPSFSPDERMVVFASDRSGTPQVYVAEIG